MESRLQHLEMGGLAAQTTTQTILGARDADGFQTVLVESINTMDEVVAEREREILAIQKSVEELALMFKDLATLVRAVVCPFVCLCLETMRVLTACAV